jgi:hypothetical protein
VSVDVVIVFKSRAREKVRARSRIFFSVARAACPRSRCPLLLNHFVIVGLGEADALQVIDGGAVKDRD